MPNLTNYLTASSGDDSARRNFSSCLVANHERSCFIGHHTLRFKALSITETIQNIFDNYSPRCGARMLTAGEVDCIQNYLCILLNNQIFKFLSYEDQDKFYLSRFVSLLGLFEGTRPAMSLKQLLHVTSALKTCHEPQKMAYIGALVKKLITLPSRRIGADSFNNKALSGLQGFTANDVFAYIREHQCITNSTPTLMPLPASSRRAVKKCAQAGEGRSCGNAKRNTGMGRIFASLGCLVERTVFWDNPPEAREKLFGCRLAAMIERRGLKLKDAQFDKAMKIFRQARPVLATHASEAKRIPINPILDDIVENAAAHANRPKNYYNYISYAKTRLERLDPEFIIGCIIKYAHAAPHDSRNRPIKTYKGPVSLTASPNFSPLSDTEKRKVFYCDLYVRVRALLYAFTRGTPVPEQIQWLADKYIPALTSLVQGDIARCLANIASEASAGRALDTEEFSSDEELDIVGIDNDISGEASAASILSAEEGLSPCAVVSDAHAFNRSPMCPWQPSYSTSLGGQLY
jgi:hypothetical protein